MPLNLDTYNDEVRQWAQEVRELIKREGQGMSIVHRSDSPSGTASLTKFRNKFTQHDGAINRVSITFPRVLIYTHKGAGKGRGGRVGSRWVDKYEQKHSTNPKSFGKMGTAGRTAKPFINAVLESGNGVEKLATIAAEQLGDVIVGNLFIK